MYSQSLHNLTLVFDGMLRVAHRHNQALRACAQTCNFAFWCRCCWKVARSISELFVEKNKYWFAQISSLTQSNRVVQPIATQMVPHHFKPYTSYIAYIFVRTHHFTLTIIYRDLAGCGMVRHILHDFMAFRAAGMGLPVDPHVLFWGQQPGCMFWRQQTGCLGCVMFRFPRLVRKLVSYPDLYPCNMSICCACIARYCQRLRAMCRACIIMQPIHILYHSLRQLPLASSGNCD